MLSRPEEQADNRKEADSALSGACLALELVHKASVLVDDALDLELERRHRATFHHKYGPTPAVLISHTLVSSAFQVAPPSLDLAGIYADMCWAELADLGGISLAQSAWHTYKELVLPKTSSMFATIFQYASRRLGRYGCGFDAAGLGNDFGNLFQISNDYFDYLISDPYHRRFGATARVTLDLWLACAIDEDEAVRQEFRGKVGECIPSSDFGNLLAWIGSRNVARLAEQRVAEAYDIATRRIASAPKSWQSILLAFAGWLRLPTAWTA